LAFEAACGLAKQTAKPQAAFVMPHFLPKRLFPAKKFVNTMPHSSANTPLITWQR
jgi:hypothetical protein